MDRHRVNHNVRHVEAEWWRDKNKHTTRGEMEMVLETLRSIDKQYYNQETIIKSGNNITRKRRLPTRGLFPGQQWMPFQSEASTSEGQELKEITSLKECIYCNAPNFPNETDSFIISVVSGQGVKESIATDLPRHLCSP